MKYLLKPFVNCKAVNLYVSSIISQMDSLNVNFTNGGWWRSGEAPNSFNMGKTTNIVTESTWKIEDSKTNGGLKS